MLPEKGEGLPFSFSLSERDRRYRIVREAMSTLGFDALIIPCNTGHNEAYQADVRYLTQVGGFATEAALFFPIEGDPACFLRGDTQRTDWWRSMQNWVQDVRPTDCAWSEGFATCIREKGMEAGRLGIVGLGGTYRSPDGLILHGTLHRLQTQFPKASLLNATEMMLEARLIKSGEEIAALQRSTEIAEISIRAAAHAANPGQRENSVYAEMIAAMVREGGELPTMILWRAGSTPTRPDRFPPHRPLAAGDVIINEVEAKCAGYMAQIRRPIFLSRPSSEYEQLHELAVESFHLMYNRMRPGATYGYVLQAYTELIDDWGYRASGVPLHGLGLGEDLPTLNLGKGLSAELSKAEMRHGQAYILGPRVTSPDGSRTLSWGDTVVVTERGVKRLGKGRGEPIIAGRP
jgi:Xaa-Pro aminopeptidase